MTTVVDPASVTALDSKTNPTTEKKNLNGVDVSALEETVKAIVESPAEGFVQFRASTDWQHGALVETTFPGYKQNGKDVLRTVPHKWYGDEPVGLLGTGLHQGPTDSLLHAMSHCLAMTTAYHGAAKNIPIDKIHIDASGSLNLQGLLDLDPTTRPGFKQIHLQMCIDSPASTAQIYDLLNYAQGRSPVCTTVRYPVNFEFDYDVDTDGTPSYTQDDEDRHGVSFSNLIGTIEAVKNDGSIGDAKFSTKTAWMGCAKVESTFEKFEQPIGNVQKRDEPITLVGDGPLALLGNDEGAGPTEVLLHAVANCISVTGSYFAAAAGIPLSKFHIDLDGDIDLQGFTDVNDFISPGYQTIRAKITTRAGGNSKEELQNFFRAICSNRSPILDTVRSPVHVTFGLTHNGKVVLGQPEM